MPHDSGGFHAAPELLGLPVPLPALRAGASLRWHSGCDYRRMPGDPASGPFSDEDTILCFPKAFAHRRFRRHFPDDPVG